MKFTRRGWFDTGQYKLRKLLLMVKKLDLPSMNHEFGSVSKYINRWEIIEPGDD